jgi:4-diphosphocytidyl-2-C-methyl-D-erythritol kinase
MLSERAYAKINLTLDVNYKRPDGFHDVDMVMQTIELSDLIWIEETEDDEIVIEATVSHIPLDKRNLAYSAVEAFSRATGVRTGLRIVIEKQVPVAAGLGGGSADAAAVLRGLNRLYGTDLPLQTLAQIGASIGSDVPFLVEGGCAIAKGRGEVLTRVEHRLKAWLVLVRPPVFVSTSTVYGAMDQYQTRAVSSSVEMIRALQSDSLDAVLAVVSNDLAPVTEQLYPLVGEVKRRMEQVAKQPVYMSGSGPTLYCVVPHENAGQRLVNAFRGFAKEVFMTRFV